jgi:hypothetical protein
MFLAGLKLHRLPYPSRNTKAHWGFNLTDVTDGIAPASHHFSHSDCAVLPSNCPQVLRLHQRSICHSAAEPRPRISPQVLSCAVAPRRFISFSHQLSTHCAFDAIASYENIARRGCAIRKAQRNGTLGSRGAVFIFCALRKRYATFSEMRVCAFCFGEQIGKQIDELRSV